jgi:hypothetical protein
MVADRTRELLFPITILVSVAVGALIGGTFARGENGKNSPLDTSVRDNKDVVDAIDAVRAELVRMRERLDAAPLPVAQTGRADTRSSAAPDTTTEISKATAALLEAASSLRSAIAGFGGGSAPLVMPKSLDPGVWNDLNPQSFAENTKAYVLWNYQQVLDRFGPPDLFGTDNLGTYWLYHHGKRSTTFRFTDGLVAAVQTND